MSVIMRLATDPPGPGECKLRIRSNGHFTSVLAVDSEGKELQILGAVAVEFSHRLGDDRTGRASVEVVEVELELDVSCETTLRPPAPDTERPPEGRT